MKSRLDEFTIAEFVDLMSGEHKVLGVLVNDPFKIARVIRDIAMEYRSIVDPAGTRTYLSDGEDRTKARNTVLFFTICNVLAELKEWERVRELFGEYGVNVDKFNDSRIKAEIKSRLAKAQNTLKRIEEEESQLPYKETDVRRDFDEQTAALMAHFKFQIDMSTMRAPLYAHLVARYNREVKAQLKALKKQG